MKLQRQVIWFMVIYGSIFGCFADRKNQGPQFYTAAVLEHRHCHDDEKDSTEQVKIKNLDCFQKAAEVASQKGVDIIVFPEYGIFPYILNRTILTQYMEHVPDITEKRTNPCEQPVEFSDRPVMLTLSCMAQRYKMYIVANVGDKQPCNIPSQTCSLDDIANCTMNEVECPEDEILLYNTDVVFDREGTLIAKYHKVHPYFEAVNVPSDANPTIFKTEFGTFGLIICFDCVFKESVELVEKFGVNTLIFSTLWFDDVLPLSSIEFQQAWALSNNVNFLAANGHKPGDGTLGSGIYSKDFGALAYTYDPDGESKLVVARLPRQNIPLKTHYSGEVIAITKSGLVNKVEKGEHFPDQCYKDVVGESNKEMMEYRCNKRQMEKYSLVKLEGPEGKLKACDNGLCCSLSYSAESMEEDYYLAVFNGTSDVKGQYFWCEENCFLIRCDALDDKLCATLPPKAQTVFRSVEIKAHLTTERVYPTVIKSYKRLAPKSEWDLRVAKKKTVLTYKSKANEPLLKAGFIGRCYDRDPPFQHWQP